ncbi:hypothetical protein ACROYT_G014063 [Oculina patagonica]
MDDIYDRFHHLLDSLDLVLLSPHFDENGKISDFCDGDLSKRPPVFSIHPGALQIFLYYDDFDVTNPLTSKTIVCPWVKVNGTLYHEGFMVALDVHDDLPTFGRISKIICVHTKEVFFFVESLKTNGIDGHANASSVERDPLGVKVLIPQPELLSHEPTQELYFEGAYYVILRRSVQAWMV